MPNDTEAMNRFLAQVERRAFRMAEFATQDTEDALDIVQNAMFALARRYANRPPDQWPPLFFRMLQNGIRDWHRRRKVRRAWTRWFGRDDDGAPTDGVDAVAGAAELEPERRLALNQAGARLIEALYRLPARQQQAFLLRAWEGLDVQETATAMGCSAGSVKTHYSRAIQRLRKELEDWRE